MSDVFAQFARKGVVHAILIMSCVACRSSPSPRMEVATSQAEHERDPRERTTDWFEPQMIEIHELPGFGRGRMVFGPDPELGEPPIWAESWVRSRVPYCAMPYPTWRFRLAAHEERAVSLEIQQMYEEQTTLLRNRVQWIESLGDWLEGHVLAIYLDEVPDFQWSPAPALVVIDLGAAHGLQSGQQLFLERRGFACGRGIIDHVEEERAHLRVFTDWPVRVGDKVYPVRLRWNRRSTTAVEAYRHAVDGLQSQLRTLERRVSSGLYVAELGAWPSSR